ncbi:MAG TPA: hypothetical protein VGC56_16070 [Allosphingosinicella sp.]
MMLLTPLAAALGFALAAPAPPDVSSTCADNPTLLNPRALSQAEISALLHVRDNPDLKVTGIDGPSFAMSGPCVATLRTVATNFVFANGRTVWIGFPPLKLVPAPAGDRYATKILPVPIDAALHTIGGANVGSRHRLVYLNSVYLDGHRRIGLWKNGGLWAVETITCTPGGACAGPVPLLTSTHPIREIGYMSSPDGTHGGSLHLWVSGDSGQDYSIRLLTTSSPR